MKRALPLILAVMAGGCGGGEDHARPKNQAAATPVVEAAPIVSQIAPAANVHSQEKRAPKATRPRAPQPSTPVRAPADYRAIGTEPFWGITVRGTHATLEQPSEPSLHFTISHSSDGAAIRYTGDGFAMTLTPGPCSDGMSDALWSDRVQIAFAQGTLKGCGGVRDEMRDDAS